MDRPASSSSESLTSRSTHSMDIDGMENFSVGETTSRNTPMRETPSFNAALLDVEKGIVVEAPDMDSSAMLVANDEEDEELEVYSPFSKRKRASVNYNLDDSGYIADPVAKRPRNVPRNVSGAGSKTRGVIVGVWRDSDQPNDADKHIVNGFIDVHERLRTRIYDMNRQGEELKGNMPTGAGGCWVTFPRVIFDPHLENLTPAEIKEYVKIREATEPDADPEAGRDADQKAVLKAKAMAIQNESIPKPPVVHRQSTGRVSITNRQSLGRQSLGSTSSFKAVNSALAQSPKSTSIAEATKPTGVMLGYWPESNQPRVEDKHAVYGVLGGSDCFRVKVARITRDGRYVDGNFPVGAGALWLHYDQIVLDTPLQGMTRPQIKEYVRIRQGDQQVEDPKDRLANEQRAIRSAKENYGPDPAKGDIDPGQSSPEIEVRHSARSEQRMAAKQQAEANAAFEIRRKDKAEARERQNEKSRREVAYAEASIQDAAQAELKNNLKKLNKVWVAQQAAIPGSSMPATPQQIDNEIKFHNGIKYERKQTGPFQGKLVSSAQIISIDGEDFVEYRVLTKPSFF